MYNSEKYIVRTLKSVVNQTCKVLEIILIDDCSSDNSVEVAKSYLESMDISYKLLINKENSGPSFSRNRGIEEASGEYIFFLDSDDLIVPFYFEHLVKAIYDYNYEFVFCNVVQCEKNIDLNSFSDVFKISEFEYGSNTSLIKRYGYSCGAVFKTSIIKNNNIKFNEDCSYMEDNLFNFNYLKYVKSAAYVESAVYCYINYSSSLAHQKDKLIIVNKTKQTLDSFEKKSSVESLFKDSKECSEYINFRRYFINNIFAEAINGGYNLGVVDQKYVYSKKIYRKIIKISDMSFKDKLFEILMLSKLIEKTVYGIMLNK